MLSVTFDAIFTYKLFEFETALCNSPKVFQRKKYENVHMKALNQHCPNVHIFMFHNFGLAAAQIEILY